MALGTQPVRIPLPKTTLLDNPLDILETSGLLFDAAGVLGPAASNAIFRDGLLETRPGLTTLGQALSEAGVGLHWTRDLTRALVLIVGTIKRWMFFNLGTLQWVDVSGGTLLAGTQGLPVSFTTFYQGGDIWVLGVNFVDTMYELKVSSSFNVGAGSVTYAKTSNGPIALDVTTVINRVMVFSTSESGTLYPFRVRWSASGDRTSWPAGAFNDLVDGGDLLVGGLALGRRAAAVYKENSQWLALAQNGSDANAFEFVQIDEQPGPIGPGAITSGPGGVVHVYIGRDFNLYQFDGTQTTMIAKTQKALASRSLSLPLTASARYFPAKRETWFALALDTDTYPSHVLVYDHDTGGFYFGAWPTTMPANQLAWYRAETAIVTHQLPNVPTHQQANVPTHQLGVTYTGDTMLAASSTQVFTLTGASDNGTAITNDWQVLLPVLDREEWEVDAVEGQFNTAANVSIQVSVRAGQSLDALTETVLGTLNPSTAANFRVATTTDQKIRARVVAVRFSVTSSVQLQLRRLEVWGWRRAIAT